MPITTKAELRALYGAVSPRAEIKMIDHLDKHCQAFIAASPFMLLGTYDGEKLDVSPKGDPAGCVIVEDGGKSMLLAVRPGNNRIDGLLNIVENPAVACLFLIPTIRETLRVNGTATIHTEPEFLDKCLVKGRRPITVTRIEVREAGMHCAKAFMRSGLWMPDTWPTERPIASMGDILVDHCNTKQNYVDEKQQEAQLEATLY